MSDRVLTKTNDAWFSEARWLTSIISVPGSDEKKRAANTRGRGGVGSGCTSNNHIPRNQSNPSPHNLRSLPCKRRSVCSRSRSLITAIMVSLHYHLTDGHKITLGENRFSRSAFYPWKLRQSELHLHFGPASSAAAFLPLCTHKNFLLQTPQVGEEGDCQRITHKFKQFIFSTIKPALLNTTEDY